MSSVKYTVLIILMVNSVTRGMKEIFENNHLCRDTVTKIADGVSYQQYVLVCCQGYILNSTNQCTPVCHPSCKFGICTAPNVCECEKGYQMEENVCVPICKNKCINGFCIRPDECGCKNGFELDGEHLTRCVPICKPKCGNYSKCTESKPPNPNRCQCIAGYSENKVSKTCKPYCKNNCHKGFCIAPETCECMEGYYMDYANKTNCIPKCEPKCQAHSSCTAPNVCNCDDGYKLNIISKKCEPICKDQVKYSRCIKPPNTWTCVENYQHDGRIDKCVLETCLCNSNGYCLEHKDECVCYAGYTKNNTTGQCEPNCQPVCENSVCVANNVCQCSDRYHKTPIEHICEHNDLCNGRPCNNGECLITGECKCKAGFIKFLSLSGETHCNAVQTFIGKIMTIFLGVPVIVASCILIAIYIIAKRKSYNVEEQELILINRN